jgi:hypothetical protein
MFFASVAFGAIWQNSACDGPGGIALEAANRQNKAIRGKANDINQLFVNCGARNVRRAMTV